MAALQELLDTILSTPIRSDRRGLIEESAKLINNLTSEAWLSSLYEEVRSSERIDRSEVMSIISETVFTSLLTNQTIPESSACAFLYASSRYSIKRHLDTCQAPLSGMSDAMRRHRIANRAADQLRGELGREPSPDETVTRAHEQLTSQGHAQRVRTRDLRAPVSVTTIDACNDCAQQEDEEPPLCRNEAMNLLHHILLRCREHSEELANIARLWLVGTYCDDRDDPSVAEIAEAAGLSQQSTRRRIERVRAISQEVCSGLLGVTQAA